MSGAVEGTRCGKVTNPQRVPARRTTRLGLPHRRSFGDTPRPLSIPHGADPCPPRPRLIPRRRRSPTPWPISAVRSSGTRRCRMRSGTRSGSPRSVPRGACARGRRRRHAGRARHGGAARRPYTRSGYALTVCHPELDSGSPEEPHPAAQVDMLTRAPGPRIRFGTGFSMTPTGRPALVIATCFETLRVLGDPERLPRRRFLSWRLAS